LVGIITVIDYHFTFDFLIHSWTTWEKNEGITLGNKKQSHQFIQAVADETKKKHKLQVKIFNKKIKVELSINLFLIKQNKVI